MPTTHPSGYFHFDELEIWQNSHLIKTIFSEHSARFKTKQSELTIWTGYWRLFAWLGMVSQSGERPKVACEGLTSTEKKTKQKESSHFVKNLHCPRLHQHFDGQQAPCIAQWSPGAFYSPLILLAHCTEKLLCHAVNSHTEIIESSQTIISLSPLNTTGINAHAHPLLRLLSLMIVKDVITCPEQKLRNSSYVLCVNYALFYLLLPYHNSSSL